MLLFINNFFNIKKEKTKLINFFLKKSWLVLKLKVFFIISKNFKKIVGHQINRRLAWSSLRLIDSGQKSSNLNRSKKLLT